MKALRFTITALQVAWVAGVGLMFSLNGCTAWQNRGWDGKLYVGDSKKVALVRSQDNEELACSDKRVDEMVCMSKGDFKDLLTKWREARANCPAPEPAAGTKPTQDDGPAADRK